LVRGDAQEGREPGPPCNRRVHRSRLEELAHVRTPQREVHGPGPSVEPHQEESPGPGRQDAGKDRRGGRGRPLPASPSPVAPPFRPPGPLYEPRCGNRVHDRALALVVLAHDHLTGQGQRPISLSAARAGSSSRRDKVLNSPRPARPQGLSEFKHDSLMHQFSPAAFPCRPHGHALSWAPGSCRTWGICPARPTRPQGAWGRCRSS